MSKGYKSPLKSSQTLSGIHLQEYEVDQVIFSLNLSLGKYNLAVYSPTMTSGKLSKNQVEDFFLKIYEATENLKNIRPTQFFKKVIILILVFVLLSLGALGGLFAIFLKQGTDVSNASQAIRIGVIALVAVSILLPLVFFILVVRYHIGINSQHREIRDRILDIIEQENTRIQKLKLRWALPSVHYNWIELWNDSKLKKLGVENPNTRKKLNSLA